MEYKLLSVSKRAEQNIGDYIQALASAQFLPSIDGFINREMLDTYSGNKTCLIMNGWFMHNAKKWPPSAAINPLFVAFHLNVSVKDTLTNNENIFYFKRHEPIGCRDYNTQQILQSYGVDSYFSGCMTLTLGYKYKSKEKDNKIYFVDPYIPSNTQILEVIKDILFGVVHKEAIIKINKKLFHHSSNNVRYFLKSCHFARLYSKFFEMNILTCAEYINQQSSYYGTLISDEEKLRVAEELVKKYAKAKFVVTSRIHCALPCLGLETPVIFTPKDSADKISKCRYGGLIELFNVLKFTDETVFTTFKNDGLITVNNYPRNSDLWKQYANDLIMRVQSFVKRSQNDI